jgi:magnesium-transporting ATPase (P-type)
MTFAGIVMAQVGAGLAMRTTRESVFSIGLMSNRFFVWGIAFELAFAASLPYIPGLSEAFHMRPLEPRHWTFLLLWPPLVLAAEEARKALVRRGGRC